MQELLELILKEVKETNHKVDSLEKKFDEKLEALEKRFDEKLETSEKRLEKSTDRKIQQALDKQTKEIAAEIHNLIEYIEEKSKKSEKKLNEEILSNKIEHNSYESRFLKIENNLKYKPV